MLGREEAQAQLAHFAATPAHPGHTRRLSEDPLAVTLDAWVSDPHSTDTAALATELDALDAKRLAQTFTVVCPTLAESLARWWVWAQGAPYLQGWDRRGFRSSSPLTSRGARMYALGQLLRLARDWPQDVSWFASWLSHLPDWRCGELAGLFAAEIDAGRSDVADILLASAVGRHPISGVSRVGLSALLGCDVPTHWEQVATLLRNAGRAEGLRSVVLEATDLARPAAFSRILDVVLEEDLLRFAGTIRAVCVWFGEELEVRDGSRLREELTTLARALVEPLGHWEPSSPPQTFIRLYALACTDALRAVPVAATLLVHPDPGIRCAAARLLAELGVAAARTALLPALADPDLRVYATAVSAFPTQRWSRDRNAALDDAALGVLLDRVRTLGKPQPIETGLVGRRQLIVGSAHAADVILAHRPVTQAPPEVVAAASAAGRWGAVRQLAENPVAHRGALFGYLTDASSGVRGIACSALETLPSVTVAEASLLVAALRRKASELRRTAITLLLRQPPEAVVASVEALRAGTADQIRAGDELAQRAGVPTTDGAPAVSVPEVPAALVVHALDRTPAIRPTPPAHDPFTRYHRGCLLLVTSLRAWLAEHADVEVQHEGGVALLSNVSWLPPSSPGGPLPLSEVFGPWWERVEPSLTDGGVELLLLRLAVPQSTAAWTQSASARVIGPLPADPGESTLVWQVLWRLAERQYRPSWTDLALDAAAAVWAELPISDLLGPVAAMAARGRRITADRRGQVDGRYRFADVGALLPLADLTRPQLERLWALARFLDEPEGTLDLRTCGYVPHRHEHDPRPAVDVPDQPWRRRPSVELLVRAVDAGVATHADLLEALLEQDAGPLLWGGWRKALSVVSARRPPEWSRSPLVQSTLAEVRTAVLAGEVARGDLPGPLTPIAGALRSASGTACVVPVLAALGQRPFTRGYSWSDSRESSLSRLVRLCVPGAHDTAEQLTAALAGAGVGEQRAVEFGVYAPQWSGLVEEHLGWPGFESAVWWVHAHTNDDSWAVDREIRDEWRSAVSQRTPLDAVDLVRGAADVAWFALVVQELGEPRFERVLAAAKYASSSGGHKRAELFARALLGQVQESSLLERIQLRRHQDSVRALGLLPLTGRDDPAVLARYELIAGFSRSDRTSGSQRRASEAAAAAIGLENLARAAGYADPGRLVWAMEAEAVRDLAAGPVTASHGTLTVTLRLSPEGAPLLDVDRAGRALASVPAASAKVPEIAELKARVTTLRHQASRMRRSLERSCIDGERFETSELADLLRHPVLAPMLRELVLVSAEGVIGFASDDARVLLGPQGERRRTDGSALAIAHPVDLLGSGEWPELQHTLFTARRTQPFRQLFRELYLPTAAETSDGPASRRYAGHQVESRRAAALFTSRGWVADRETGFSCTHHQQKLTAWCGVLDGWGTAAEVADATLQDLTFTRAGNGHVVPIAEVPPRLFSETMRDLDLVVSVAHSGGTDPESSESTTEMRRRLVEETADILGLDNVELTGHHALVRGRLGSYSVQLGSGVVHRIPGNALCIIPISAQHRGRIFLPFADDDPRTAEVISKVVLLARDWKIQDPTILEQLT